MTSITTIPVQYTNSDNKPVAMVSFNDFNSTGNAEPTSRVLDGSIDHGYAEEWAENGYIILDGEKRQVTLIYLFEENEISDEPENYPWDEKHAARLLLAD